MKQIILYGSRYGTARQYAEALSRQCGIPCISWQAAAGLAQYDTIVYIGALYAGGVLGLSKTFRTLREPGRRRILIATVGLADPADPENTAHIRESLRRQVSGAVYDAARLYHLRGGIDYAGLSLQHRMMMAMLCQKIRRMPQESLRAEDCALLETYNQKVDFVDFMSLAPLRDALQA